MASTASSSPTTTPKEDLLSTPWYEISDDDQDDQETVKRKVADRCRMRREQALALTKSASPDEQTSGKFNPTSPLRRTKTQQHSPPTSNSGGKPSPSSPLNSRNNTALPSSPATSLWRASKASSCSPLARREKAFSSECDQITLNTTKVCRAFTSSTGEVELSEYFDIWYANPSNLKRRGTDCHTYACALQQVGEFHTLSDFYAFHNALDWANIKDGSIIAYSRKGIKPQWEDPSNQRGGRFVLRQFPRPDTESIFTHIALGFFSGMVTDWENYNVVSLHVRSGGRGSDVQLWRSIDDSNGGLSCAMVKADLRSIINVPQMTITWVPNQESVSRNDSRLGRSGRSRGGLGDNYINAASASLDYGDKGARTTTQDLVESLYEKRGSSSLPNDLREQIMAQQATDFAHATPVGIGLHVPEAMQVSLSGSGAAAFTHDASPRGSITAGSESSTSVSAQLIPTPTPFSDDTTTTTTRKTFSYSKTLSSHVANAASDSSGSSAAKNASDFDDSSSAVASPVAASSKPKPKSISGSRFGFLKGVLSSSTASTSSSVGNGPDSPVSPTIVDSKPLMPATIVDKPNKGALSRVPYPAYELPMQIQAWQLGMEQLQARTAQEQPQQ